MRERDAGLGVLGRTPVRPGVVALAWSSLWPHSVSAQKLLGSACFSLYEFWRDEASWRR